jgi:hypothetical protein
MRHLYRSILHDAGIPQVAIDTYMGHKPVGRIGQTNCTHVMRGAADRVRNALETSWAENDVRSVCVLDGDQAADLRR